MHRSPPDGRLSRRRLGLGQLARPRTLGILGVLACAGAAMLPTGAAVDHTSSANAAPANAATGAGNGFVVTAGDLTYILKQIKISERHAAAFKGDALAAPARTTAEKLSDPNYCQALIGPAVDQIPDALTSYGLRTVDGSCNNIVKNDAATLDKRDRFGAADQPFPRLTSANFRAAEASSPLFGPPHPTTYADHSPGNMVFDSQPRVVSNLIVDQTSTNPAAVDVAANPARTQADPDVVIACTQDPPENADCVPQHQTLFIPNITTDVGLSPPFNSWFTFFGQFFDHGVDQTVKSSGTVFVPLQADDPLILVGPDGKPNTGDEVTDPNQQFMVLTRAQNQPGPDGILGNADDIFDATNTDTPWVDQSQTYTSHSSHQFFLRKYNTAGPDQVPGNADDALASDGTFLNGLPAGQTYAGNLADGTGASADGTDGMSTWTSTKKQARELFGMDLHDTDVTNIPLIAMDPYGEFIPGPNGLPQYVTQNQNEVQSVVGTPGLTTFTLDAGHGPTAAIPANANGAAVCAALAPVIGAGNTVSCTGSAVTPRGVRVTFGGGLANTNVPLLVSSDPAAGVFELTQGGAAGLVEGNLAAPVAVPANAVHFDTPFLTDIAHNADPSPVDTDHNANTPAVAPVADNDGLDANGDEIHTPSADFAHQPVGTYDDELLDAHFTCGDGRCNENIALSAVHTVFHSEHNRLVGDILNTLNKPENAALLTAYKAAHDLDPGAGVDDVSFGFGGRLFQAARFVTEMEYQHLVFEEFARKVVPAIRPFHVYSTDTNPAVEAEFAHAVYRFGHSMLDDDVARTSTVPVDPTDATKGTKLVGNNLKLLDAFLNPPAFFDNSSVASANAGADPTYSAAEAVGAIVMGSSDQTGNEIDEFVTETLRNNLLGLPLDLPAINMARARSEGIPPLNEVRREIHAKTNDAQLEPYTSWSDYGQHLKHPQSLVNYVAAYGTHPTILWKDGGPDADFATPGDNTPPTLESRRNAARAIVDPQVGDVPPPDAGDFMFSTGAWAPAAGGVTTTGLDRVDLWVGGLGEVTNLFGGMLGSTFNYVFQTQLEKLQDFDRFYYLNRTPGMNLRSQLEGNTFAEMITRNSANTQALKADVFATADCKFQLGNLVTPALAGSAITGPGSVQDDPATDCNENLVLLARPNNDTPLTFTFQYRARNTVDPSGINGQSVYYGTDGVDHVMGGNDNDTFWGGFGRDHIEGNGGDDIAFGGEDDDFITDLDGADILEGGPGNDAIDSGPGDDINVGNDGKDFILGGANDNETFAGEGTDFINAGQGADAVFGDGGDDWIEGGSGQDLLQGDHGAPFFDDPAETAPGNDVFIGQVGENDYDAEGGDDIMEQNAAVDRNAGAAGFDWAIHEYDTAKANDDLMINQMLFGLPLQIVVNRDRWQETEADTGSDNFADTIRGDGLERIVGPAGFSGCDALDQNGIDRITGLGKFVSLANAADDHLFPTADVAAVSAAGRCPLDGPFVWAQGNILMGGGQSDLLEGRDNDDILDGDNSLNVRISVRANSDGTGPEIGSANSMTGEYELGNPLNLSQAVFAGIIDPGQLVPVREILGPNHALLGDTPDNADAPAQDCKPADLGVDQTTDVPSTGANCDIAEYSVGSGNFSVTRNADGSVTVTDTAEAAARDAVIAAPPFTAADVLFAGKGDGIDTLWNIEALRFCTGNDPVSKNCNLWETFLVDDLVGAAGTPATPGVVGPTPVLFGTVTIGNASTQAITITNTGGGFLTPGTATISGPNAADFTIVTDGCDTVALGGGGTCNITVAFNPTVVGAESASLDIPNNATPNPLPVALSGNGVAAAAAPVASINRPANFGTRRVGEDRTQVVTIRNTGGAPLTLNAVNPVTSSQPLDFSVEDLGTCAPPAAIPVNGTCRLSVTFHPREPLGPKTATLTVNSNASNSPTQVALAGASKEAAVVVGALRIVQPATRATVRPVNVSLHISTAASIRLQVRKTNGKLVWSKRVNAKKGTAKLRWNLRDSKGHRVKKGKYIFTITVTDKSGAQVIVKRTVRVR